MSKNRYLNFLNCLIIIVVICSTSGEDLTLTGITHDPGIILGDDQTTTPTSTITLPTTTPTSTTPRPGDNSTVLPYERASSSGGLSTGGIVGIVIPCVAALIGVGAAAALCKAAPAPISVQTALPPPNFIDTSLQNFTTPIQQVQQIPVQPPQIVEAPVLETPVVQEVPPEPVRIIRPPPKKMALVQEVVHQPVQVIEQVPVVEQVPVFEQVPVIEQAPILQQVPVIENVPALQQVPVIQQVPALHQVPAIQQVPFIHQFPGIQQGIPEQHMVHQIGPIGQQIVHLPPDTIV